METWVEEIEDWDARSFSGGYAGLRDLADREFSGAVSSGSAWLFMVNGRVVGVVERRQTATGSEVVGAELDRFEDAEGTTYVAPDPSVPLLFAMQTADGETRAKYYTEDTPLREVHDTLTDGGFTGYIELSENVLSGDYYVVYQGGNAMELAFIGNARRLLTDDEAFDRAADEVGIYEVTAVELDVADIPEPAGTAGGDGAAGAGAAAGGAGAAAGTAAGSAPGADAAAGTEADDVGGDGSQGEAATTPAGADADDGAEAAGGQAAAEPGDAAETEAAANAAATDETGGSEAGAGEDEPRTDEAGTGTTGGTATDDVDGAQEPTDTTAGDGPTDATGDGPTDATAEAGTTAEGAPDGGAAGAETPPTDADQAAGTTEQQAHAGDQSGTGTGSDPGRSPPGDDRPAGNQSRPTDAANAGGGRTHRQDDAGGAAAGSPADQLVDRTVPSLDPDRTGVGDAGGAGGPAGIGGGAGTDQATAGTTGQSGAREAGGQSELREELAERERELEEARSALEEIRDEREALRDERDELQGTVEELRRRVDELESDVERARTAAREAGAATGEGPTLSAAEAFAGTNLFVRYDSKSELTLEDAHGGAGDPEELAANLALEHHTQFDSEGASVGGRKFASWLRSTQEFRFVRWLVTELLFEIRETGAADAMRDLYDALPEVDRVEIDAAVDVETEEGTEHREFDLVARDRMGQPLVVANLDDSRQPVSEGEMADLVGSCTEVCHTQETLSGAFFVATSFFDPDALETARDATSDSLLSRDKRRSFVKLSRKRGFHLGLVEDRDSSFHLSIPDL